MPSTCEVAVTGIGVVCPFGVGREAFRLGLAGCREPDVQTVEAFDQTVLAGQRAGAIPGLADAAATLPGRMRKFMSEAALLGCLAGREAWQAAGAEGRLDGGRVGLFAASGLTAASFDSAADMLTHSIGDDGCFSEALLGARGLALVNPLDSFKILPNMAPCILSMLLGIRGPSLIFSPFEDQGAAALVEAARAVAEGDVDAALAGAADTASAPSTLVFLRQSGELREGAVASPAAAYLLLERIGAPAIATLRLLPGDCVAPSRDPLEGRIGRTLAAAPALALAAACVGMTGSPKVRESESPEVLGLPGAPVAFVVERVE